MLRNRNTIIFIVIVGVSLLLHAAALTIVARRGGLLLPLQVIGSIYVNLAAPEAQKEPPPPPAVPPVAEEAEKVERPKTPAEMGAPLRGEAKPKAATAPPTGGESVPSRRVRIARHPRETLSFDIYWSGIHVGQAVLDATSDESLVKITSTVKSNAVISAVYRVEDYAESRVLNGRAVGFKLKQSEGKHRGDKETLFDVTQGVVTYMNHLQQTVEKHPMENRRLWDVMSGFFYLRTLPLTVGKPAFVDIFDNNKFFSAEVEVLRTEMMELPDGGEAETIVIRPVLKTEGLFKRTGDIFIWLTNDENRTPVRVETKIKIGKVTAVLRKVEIKE